MLVLITVEFWITGVFWITSQFWSQVSSMFLTKTLGINVKITHGISFNNSFPCTSGVAMFASTAQVFHPHINMWHLVVIYNQRRKNFSYTHSLSSSCVNLFLRSVLLKNDVFVGAGTVNDEKYQIFPIFLAGTTTYILLFHLNTWVFNIHL